MSTMAAVFPLSVTSRIFQYLSRNASCHMKRCVSTSYRSVLYVPGNDVKKIRKTQNLMVDCVALDCEDGVAANKKMEARETINNELNRDDFGDNGAEIAVRVNSVGSGLCVTDIESVLSAKKLPGTILLPKVESTEDLNTFAEAVWQALLKRNDSNQEPLRLMMLIESARAIMNLPELCTKAEQLSTMAPIWPVGLILGRDDLVADLGATRTKSGLEILYARQRLVLVAKAFRLQAIDLVHIDYRNHGDLKREAEEGAIMGYNGKQVIHPSQIPIVQEAFRPSKATIEWAKGLLSAFEENQKNGLGAFTYRGCMIDMPTFRQAQNVIDLAAKP